MASLNICLMNNNRLDEGKYLKPNPDKIEALIMKDNNLGLFLRESYFPPKEQVCSLGEMMDQAFPWFPVWSWWPKSFYQP